MGVVNLTPDSFFDGGCHYPDRKAARDYASRCLASGAHIIDIGGESTRPVSSFHNTHGARKAITAALEWERIAPLITELGRFRSDKDFKISVDTRKLEVARLALQNGADWINCVSSELSPAWGELLASRRNEDKKIIICHLHGKLEATASQRFIREPLLPYLCAWFSRQIATLKAQGVGDEQIILDPGIGFGKKRPDQDLVILKGLGTLKQLGYPVAVGLSRKSFMGEILAKRAPELLAATIAMNTLAIANGAEIIRVHDVAEHIDLRKLWMALGGAQDDAMR